MGKILGVVIVSTALCLPGEAGARHRADGAEGRPGTIRFTSSSASQVLGRSSVVNLRSVADEPRGGRGAFGRSGGGGFTATYASSPWVSPPSYYRSTPPVRSTTYAETERLGWVQTPWGYVQGRFPDLDPVSFRQKSPGERVRAFGFLPESVRVRSTEKDGRESSFSIPVVPERRAGYDYYKWGDLMVVRQRAGRGVPHDWYAVFEATRVERGDGTFGTGFTYTGYLNKLGDDGTYGMVKLQEAKTYLPKI